MHSESHPYAGATVTLSPKLEDPNSGIVEGAEYRIEDWWDKLTGKSWMFSDGNPAALKYALRAGMAMGRRDSEGIPTDDEVVYGKINGLGNMMHVSELNIPTENKEN